MKVKIIKCSESRWWYFYRIGEVFEVSEDPLFPNKYKTLITITGFAYGTTGKGLISKEDCELLDTPKLLNRYQILRKQLKMEEIW